MCRECQFWDPIPETDGGQSTAGFCRGYCPRPGNPKETYRNTVWPITSAHDWCGEWEARIEDVEVNG